MRIVFMVEEPSMKAFLQIILPQMLPENVESLIISHSGKSDLRKSIPIKLRAWQFPSDRFVIVHDQDSNDCKQLKDDLVSLCENSRNTCLVRIVCIELEAWYFGDLQAVSSAYGKDIASFAMKRKFREPDSIVNAKNELRKLIPTYQPIEGAKKIAVCMDIRNNTSRSFNVFVDGVKNMLIEMGM